MEEKTILLYFILIVLSEENLKHLVATDAAPGIICLRSRFAWARNVGNLCNFTMIQTNTHLTPPPPLQAYDR